MANERLPTLEGVTLGEQISHGLLTTDEHKALVEQPRFKHVAMGLETLLRELRVTEEVEGFLEAGHGTRAREGLGGHHARENEGHPAIDNAEVL